MDFFQLIDDIAQVDAEVYDRFDSRRVAFRHLLGFGKKATAAALPLGLSALFSKAYGQTISLSPAIVGLLNLALQLEYLEKYFYQTALASPALALTAEETTALRIILNDENLHIATLRNVLGSNAIADPGRPAFDFTGSQSQTRVALFPTLGGASTPTTGLFTDKAMFFVAAQQFVDTGVRAYKGGAPLLNTNTTKDLLEAALNIHSVEARHSARIRSLRRGGIQNTALPKSWITPDEVSSSVLLPNNGVPNTPSRVGAYLAGNPAALYPAENNVTQAGVNVQPLIPAAGSAAAGNESFDEPLDAATVKAIAKNFAANPTALFN